MDQVPNSLRIMLFVLVFVTSFVGLVCGLDYPVGDLNEDYKINLPDLLLLSIQWLDDAGCSGFGCGDLVGSDGVNFGDFGLLAGKWLKGYAPVINEFMASNSQTLDDEDGDSPDWIEIHNPTEITFDLEGWYLTDDADNLTKWKFPAGTSLQPDEYLVVFASGRDRKNNPNYLHTNFELSADGDYLALVEPDGINVVSEYMPEYPEQRVDVSYGFYYDQMRYFGTPTPAAANSDDVYIGLVADTKFSVDRGFYDAAFDVDITCSTPGATIYYTLDGSEPTQSGTEYTGPVSISATTTLRAKAFKSGWLPTNVDTQTYLLNVGNAVKSLPVISIVADEQTSLYEPDGVMAISGGYYDDAGWHADSADDYNNPMVYNTNFNNPVLPDRDYERPVSVEIIDWNQNQSFQTDCGLRIHGSDYTRPRYTRGEDWTNCSGGWNSTKMALKLYFRNQYDTSRLEYPLFELSEIDRWRSVVLRAGHNDQCNPFIKDELFRRLHRDMGCDSLVGIMANLFINGQYKGFYNPCERVDQEFLQEFHDSNMDWDVLTQSSVWTGEARDGDMVAWWAMVDYFNSNDLSDAAKYQQAAAYLDIEAFVDYLIIQLYSGNWDWPGNNWTAAAERSSLGRFRFYVWDIEGAADAWALGGSLQNTAFDDFPSWMSEGQRGLNYMNDPVCQLYRALKANTDFRQLFADRIQKHFYNGGALMAANILTRFYELRDEMSVRLPGMSLYIPNTFVPQRWPAMLTEFINQNLFDFKGPVFKINGADQHGGYADTGDTLSMVNSHGSGDIYYTLDDSDPRLNGIPGIVSALVSENATKAVLIPTGPISDDWKGGNEPFDDSAWNDGTIIPDKTGGVGYDTDTANGRPYAPYITVDVESQMYSSYTTCYIRVPFTISEDANNFDFMTLKIRYDDAFVAYINGQEVKRVNFTGSPQWNSAASAGHEDAGPESFDISGYISALQDDENILAIHGLNVGTTSSDFLISVELNADTSSITGGGLSPDALNYTTTGSITLTKSTRVKARIKDGSQWSALSEATYGIDPVARNLRITEIMYHPPDPNHEFIELKNIGTETLNLALVKFTDGIDFTFPSVQLVPCKHVVVVKDQAQFEAKYGTGIDIAGVFTQSLSNAGEDIKLEDAIGETILEFDYSDDWFDITDGDGFSLTVRDPNNADPNDWGDKKTWRPSATVGGSPGWDDTGVVPQLGAIVINEILAHSHAMDPDWIELYNTTAEPINIGGWFLSDSDADDPNRKKYEIATGTVIPDDGYVVFYEDLHFGNIADSGCHDPFAMSENGETLYLQSGQSGILTGYYDDETFDASETNVAFGRYYKASTDSYNFVAMSANTPGLANAYPKVGPIVISEIMYNPRDPNLGSPYTDNDDFEYVELHNIDAGPVTLQEYDNDMGIDVGWRFTDENEAIDFTFPLSTTIPAGGYLVLVKNEDAFNYRYTAPGGAVILEWGDGKCNNGGEKINLQMPGDMVAGQRYYIRIDRVNYSDGSHPPGNDPWPTGPDGTGQSLHRIIDSNYGNDVANWKSASPKPGR